MFKRIKESPTYEKIKELWNNSKTRSIIVLGFWLAFIFLVIVFARVSFPSSNESNVIINDNFASLNSYDFTYETSDLLISGQQYDKKQLFYLNNHRYYYNENVYLFDDKAIIQNNFDLNVLKINHLFLNNLLNGINYSNGDGFRQYVVSLDRFINLYEIDTDLDLSKAMNYNIVVTVYTSDNIINKVVMDLTNYRILKTGDNTRYLLNIYYYNVNKLSDFSIDFDKRIGVVE
ncbi:MAG: hypothetical protein IJ093_02735 [Bacilli bacterium]|nr:hypothetical protein [Bacilli bacterium]